MAFNKMDKEAAVTAEMREYYFQDFEIELKLANDSKQWACCYYASSSQ